MKYKVNLFIFPVLIGLFVLFFACSKNDFLSHSADTAITDGVLDIAQAKKYYAKLKKEQGTAVTSIHAPEAKGAKKRPNYKYVIWQKAYAGQTDRSTFVEIPILYNQRPSVIFNRKDAPVDPAENIKVLNASFDRLIIYKSKKNRRYRPTDCNLYS